MRNFSSIIFTSFNSANGFMYIIDKKYLDEELFEMYMPVFKRESFVRKTLWAVSAYALLAVVFVYVTVSIGLFFMS